MIGDILELVLHYMYAESVLKSYVLTFLDQENFTELMMAARVLQIDELSCQLKIFSLSNLSVNLHNCLKLYVAYLWK